MFSNKNFFVGEAGGWITSLWQDISAPLATQKGVRQPTCNAREILAVCVYAKQLHHGHFNIVLFSIFPKQLLQPYSSPKAVLIRSSSKTLTTLHAPPPRPKKIIKINGHFATCPTRWGFPFRSTVMAQRHGCSFRGLREALPRRAGGPFSDTCHRSPGGTRPSSSPARTGALHPGTHHSNKGPRDLQLPLTSR